MREYIDGQEEDEVYVFAPAAQTTITVDGAGSDYNYHNVSGWLDTLNTLNNIHIKSGWEIVRVIVHGLATFASTPLKEWELIELVAIQLNRKTKTIMNLRTVGKSPIAQIAQNYGLSVGHAEAVLRFSDNVDQADDYLSQAHANGWSVQRLRWEVNGKMESEQKSVFLRQSATPDDAVELLVGIFGIQWVRGLRDAINQLENGQPSRHRESL